MLNTTKKTEVGADGRAKGPICPISRQPCLGERCAWWCEDWKACAVGALGVYNLFRDALADAAVDVIDAYKEES